MKMHYDQQLENPQNANLCKEASGGKVVETEILTGATVGQIQKQRS